MVAELSDAPSNIAKKMFIAKSNLEGDKLRQTFFGDLKVMEIQVHRVAIGQLELIGAEDLVKSRRDEIVSFLSEVKKNRNSEYTFVNMKDLDLGVSFILCLDKKTQELLIDAPGIEWSDDALGISRDFTLRKQMSAWIDEKLKK